LIGITPPKHRSVKKNSSFSESCASAGSLPRSVRL